MPADGSRWSARALRVISLTNLSGHHPSAPCHQLSSPAVTTSCCMPKQHCRRSSRKEPSIQSEKNKHKREPRNANSNAAVPTKQARDKRRIRGRIIIRIALLTVIVRVGWAIGFVLFTKSNSQKPLPMPSCPPTTSTPMGGTEPAVSIL